MENFIKPDTAAAATGITDILTGITDIQLACSKFNCVFFCGFNPTSLAALLIFSNVSASD